MSFSVKARVVFAGPELPGGDKLNSFFTALEDVSKDIEIGVKG